MNSPVLCTDAYKLTHWKQYPAGTERIYSYLESRGGAYHETVFFGLQMILQRIKDNLTACDLKSPDRISRNIFGTPLYFNQQGWYNLLEEYQGLLPIRIKAVPEGSVVPTGIPLMTIENTDEKYPWLTNYVESLLLQIWYPTTIATMGYNIRKTLERHYREAGIEYCQNHFALNDFGFRGVSSVESAGIGGCAHLVNFAGTDNLMGVRYAETYYNAPAGTAGTVLAAEHSTITAYGPDQEQQAYINAIRAAPEDLTVSLVCDSYDYKNVLWNMCMQGKPLWNEIMGRTGKTVFRPDSGDPVKVVLDATDALWSHFGGSVNKAGYKVLDPHVGLIYADGINQTSITAISNALMEKKYAPSNVIYGMGGSLLQGITRDTCRFAIKCSAAKIDGEWRDVRKAPVGDKTKWSKGGRFAVIQDRPGIWYVEREEDCTGKNMLETVYENGELVRQEDFRTIRDRVTGQIDLTP